MPVSLQCLPAFGKDRRKNILRKDERKEQKMKKSNKHELEKLPSSVSAADASESTETKADIESDEDIQARIRQLEYENAMLKKQKEIQAMEQTVKEWMKDGELLKESYPDFNIETEAQNPEFVKLLKGGSGLRNAYLAMHHDEIVKALVEKAVREAQEKTTESIKARNQRPLENGMSSKSTALFKTDVSKLTPAQRAEIAKRVARGEVISF